MRDESSGAWNWAAEIFSVLFVIVVSIALRAIPDFAIHDLPVGYDVGTSYLQTMTQIVQGEQGYFQLSTLWPNQALLYLVFQLVYLIFHWSPVFLLQVVSVGVFVFANAAAYLFCRRGLGLPVIQALLVTVLYMLDLATLRISWDLLRNELGLGFLFMLLTAAFSDAGTNTRRQVWQMLLALVCFLLVVASHQLVVAVAAILLITRWLWEYSWFSILVAAGFLTLFFLPLVVPNLVMSGYAVTQVVSGVSFDRGQPATLFLFLYGLQLPFLLIGVVVARQQLARSLYLALLIWMLCLLAIVGSSVLFYPAGYVLWDRWLYLLPLPIAVFTFLGIERLVQLLPEHLNRGVVTTLVIGILTYRATAFAISPKVDRMAFSQASFPLNLTQTSVGYDVENDAYRNLVRATHALPYNATLILATRYQGVFELWGGNDTLYVLYSDDIDDQAAAYRLLDGLAASQRSVYVFDQHMLRSYVDTQTVLTIQGHSLVRLKLEGWTVPHAPRY